MHGRRGPTCARHVGLESCCTGEGRRRFREGLANVTETTARAVARAVELKRAVKAEATAEATEATEVERRAPRQEVTRPAAWGAESKPM